MWSSNLPLSIRFLDKWPEIKEFFGQFRGRRRCHNEVALDIRIHSQDELRLAMRVFGQALAV